MEDKVILQMYQNMDSESLKNGYFSTANPELNNIIFKNSLLLQRQTSGRRTSSTISATNITTKRVSQHNVNSDAVVSTGGTGIALTAPSTVVPNQQMQKSNKIISVAQTESATVLTPPKYKTT